jgi:hypothetical protein
MRRPQERELGQVVVVRPDPVGIATVLASMASLDTAPDPAYERVEPSLLSGCDLHLVLGASGGTGRAIVRELAER